MELVREYVFCWHYCTVVVCVCRFMDIECGDHLRVSSLLSLLYSCSVCVLQTLGYRVWSLSESP